MKIYYNLIIKVLLLIICFSTQQMEAQAPQKMSYQAVIRNTSNALVVSTTVGMRISILQGSSTGSSVYTETQTLVTNANGLVSLEIGTGTVVSGTFSAINWATGPYFIKTEADPTGGNSYTILGTTQLTSVPYALFSATSGSGETPGTNVGDMKYWNGSAWVMVPIGAPGQTLKVSPSNIPQWTAGSPLSTVSSDYVTSVQAQDATVGGTVSNSGGELVLSRGFCYSTSANPTVSNNVVLAGAGLGSFASMINGLAPNTLYYVKAFSTTIAGTAYGNQMTFTTQNGAATVTTTTANTIAACSAMSGGTVISDGGSPISFVGVCWNTAPNPTTSNFAVYTGGTNYTSNLTGLSGNTTYYYRAFVINGFGTFYGNEMSFLTTSGAATLTTASATSVGPCTANVAGNVTYNGGEALTISGICYATTTNPTTSNNNIPYNPGYPNYDTLTNFTANLTGLTAGTTYYVRAYTTNCAGTTYGNQISFTTTTGAATLTTASATSVTACTANLAGAVSFDGGSPLTMSGICYATTTNPTTSNSNIPYNPGYPNYDTLTNFTANLTGLIAGTTYYVRAYTTNCAGITYGNQITFTTLALTQPVVTTGSMGTATSTTVAFTSNLIAPNSCETPSAYGLCWNTSPNPTTANNSTINTTPTATFNDTVFGLTAGNTYYVRAYATNSAGTSYGSQVSFTLGAPTVSTSPITDIKGNAASAGGNIINNGLSSISAFGLCWSTSPNPTTANSVTTSFTAVMTGLTPNTTYYVRAFATNSFGTGYGNQYSFNSGYLIGTNIFGGLVFYNDGNSHGVVCATSDQSTGATWGCDGIATGASSHLVFDGAPNTNTIVSFCGTAGIAAEICNNLVLNGYNDWYLPSIDELIIMDLNLDNASLGGFAPTAYWSSTETGPSNAYSNNFFSTYFFGVKTSSYRVRAVRSF
ncbi:MAG: DUF1566 domain-containing protein [Flavobacterium sp.]|nr:DUF1566 domain-containing protein [Flavobacterium sp.]